MENRDSDNSDYFYLSSILIVCHSQLITDYPFTLCRSFDRIKNESFKKLFELSFLMFKKRWNATAGLKSPEGTGENAAPPVFGKERWFRHVCCLGASFGAPFFLEKFVNQGSVRNEKTV